MRLTQSILTLVSQSHEKSTSNYEINCGIKLQYFVDATYKVSGELLRLIEVGASCFNHYCIDCDNTQLNVLHNVHRRIS